MRALPVESTKMLITHVNETNDSMLQNALLIHKINRKVRHYNLFSKFFVL